MKAYKKDYMRFARNLFFFFSLVLITIIWSFYTEKLFILSENVDIRNFIILVRIVFFLTLILLGAQYIYRWRGERELCKHIQCSLFEHSRNNIFLIEGILLILFAAVLILFQIKNILIYL